MLNIDIFTSGVVGLFLGLLLIVAGGSSFGSSAGVIVFCYGLLAILYAGFNKIMGREKV